MVKSRVVGGGRQKSQVKYWFCRGNVQYRIHMSKKKNVTDRTKGILYNNHSQEMGCRGLLVQDGFSEVINIGICKNKYKIL